MWSIKNEEDGPANVTELSGILTLVWKFCPPNDIAEKMGVHTRNKAKK